MHNILSRIRILKSEHWITDFGSGSVPDPEPEESKTFCRIRIRFGTEINVSDPDSNPEPKLDPKKIFKSLIFRLK
jgi:hypothetical protein